MNIETAIKWLQKYPPNVELELVIGSNVGPVTNMAFEPKEEKVIFTSAKDYEI